MTSKLEIVTRLGEKAVLLPSLIGEALAANDRLKLRLSLLQEASLQAQTPGRVARAFGTENRAAGLTEPDPDALVASARMVEPGRIIASGIRVLIGGIASDLSLMLVPLTTAGVQACLQFTERAAIIAQSLPACANDEIRLHEIDALASANRDGPDSLHLLVMDLHKELNRLAADTAPERVDGAHVHSINERDRQAVQAFMRGLNRTAPLAFGHPGLGTTAVRAAGRLTIQNDIGTTDAHVIVIHVESKEVSVIYTDNHRLRAKFFMALLGDIGVTWSSLAERPGEGLDEDVFYLVSGRYASEDERKLDGFLEFLGSRIVYLIDWNKARKALQTFVGQGEAIELLTWAAVHDFGHRAFLELGGVDLIFEAIHRAAAERIPYGVRLDEALGTAECEEFLQHVLRDTSQGLALGRTARLIGDEIRADLSRRFESAENAVLAVLVRHLGLTRTLAESIAHFLGMPQGTTADERKGLARRAKRIEEKADRLTVSAREIAARIREGGSLRPAIDEVENTTDALEDCAFLLSLMPEGEMDVLDVPPLVRLAETVTSSVTDLVRAVESASRLPEGQRADAIASLQSLDAVVLAERGADAAERDTFAGLMAVPRGDARALALGLEIAHALEAATDHLSHAALSLRDRVLEELSA